MLKKKIKKMIKNYLNRLIILIINLFKLSIKSYHKFLITFNRYLYKFIVFFDVYKDFFFYNFFGFNFVLFLVYSRILIERLPQNLNNFNYYLIIIGIVIIFVQTYSLYLNITNMFVQKNIEKPKKGFFYNIKKRIKLFYRKGKKKYIHPEDLTKIKSFIYYWQLPTRIEVNYTIFLDKINDSDTLREFYYPIIMKNIIKFTQVNMFNILYVLIFILPKLFITIVFFLEVIIFKEINYFYKVLWVLIIPLFGRILRFTLIKLPILRIEQLLQVITYRSFPNINIQNYKDTLMCKHYLDIDNQQIYQYCWLSTKCLELFKEEDLTLIFFELLNNKKIFIFGNKLYSNDETIDKKMINIVINILTLTTWVTIIIKMISLYFS